MGELDSEPSMEDILSSIKRIIAEEGDPAATRGRRIGRPIAAEAEAADHDAPQAAPPEAPAQREPESPQPEPQPQPQPQPEPRPATFASVSPEATVRAAASIDPAILSPQVAEAARGRIEALSRMIVRPEVAGSDTLEGVVRDMLKPMLTEWLDANLPRIVEGIVEREIERISGRRDA